MIWHISRFQAIAFGGIQLPAFKIQTTKIVSFELIIILYSVTGFLSHSSFSHILHSNPFRCILFILFVFIWMRICWVLSAQCSHNLHDWWSIRLNAFSLQTDENPQIPPVIDVCIQNWLIQTEYYEFYLLNRFWTQSCSNVKFWRIIELFDRFF